MSSKSKRVGDCYIHFLLYCSINYIIKITSLTWIRCSYRWVNISLFNRLHTDNQFHCAGCSK